MMTALLLTAAALFLTSIAIAYRLLRKPSQDETFTGEHVGPEYVTPRMSWRTPEQDAAGMQ